MKATADFNMVNAYIPGRANVGPATEAMIERRNALLGPAYRLMYEHPLHIVRGDGVWLIDPQGRRYLDVYNNVTSLGHCHPAVTEAICRQVNTLATNTRYLHDTILELAERLLASVPGTDLAHLMLTCTGSEANDLAYRIAKVRTGGTGVIVTDTAYHGITDAVSQFSPSLGVSVDLGPHVRLVPAPCKYHAEGADHAPDVNSVTPLEGEAGIPSVTRPKSGRISFDGIDLATVAAARRPHLGIAHVPEGRQVFPSLTVMENLEMGAFTEAGRRNWKANIERILAWLPVLADRRSQLAGTLSGGEQQMVAVGRGLASHPKLLMLDEPSMGLAPTIADFIFDKLMEIRRQTKLTILLVEQRVAEALESADHGYVLEAGRVVLQGTSQSLRADDRVRQAYLGL